MVKRAWLFLAVLLSGCATYQSLYLSDVNLNIGTFTNFTYESSVSGILRKKLNEEASFLGAKIGESKKVLKGEIVKVDYYPVLLDKDRKIVELKASMVVKAELMENGEKVWEKEFQDEEISFLKGYWKETREELLENLCGKLARKIIYSLQHELYRRKTL